MCDEVWPPRSFESSAVFGAAIGDLEPQAIAAYARLLHQDSDPRQFLRSCVPSFLVKTRGEEYPSAAAILLFGSNPQKFFPHARIRVAIHAGNAEDAPAVDEQLFEGRLLEQYESAVSCLTRSILGALSGGWSAVPACLKFVLRELLVNAAMHRDYSMTDAEITVRKFHDRMVVESPGALPPFTDVEDLLNIRFSRNPLIADYFRAYRHVSELGGGVDRVHSDLAKAGLPAPRNHTDGTRLMVTVRLQRDAALCAAV